MASASLYYVLGYTFCEHIKCIFEFTSIQSYQGERKLYAYLRIFTVDHPWQGFMTFQCCQYNSAKLHLPHKDIIALNHWGYTAINAIEHVIA